MNHFRSVTGLATVAFGILGSSLSSYAEEMTFHLVGNGGNCNGCEWIAADGEITQDSPAKLAALMAEGKYGSVVFNSPGGNLTAGIEMGIAIRAAGYSTNVGKTVPDEYGNHTTEDGICASACAFAFLGGTTRYVEHGKIGVHQFYNGEAIERPGDKLFTAIDLSVNQYIEALLMEYVLQMGADYHVVSKAATTSPGDMYFLTDYDLQEWNVTFDADAFKPWQIEAWKNGVVAFSKSSDGKKTATVFCSDPKHPKLLITDSSSGLKGPFEPVKSYTSAIDVFGMRVPASRISMSEENGEYKLAVGLDGLKIGSLLLPDWVSISAVDAPRYAWPFFQFRLNDKDAFENIRVALNNCI